LVAKIRGTHVIYEGDEGWMVTECPQTGKIERIREADDEKKEI
jgi:hypothetical protein